MPVSCSIGAHVGDWGAASNQTFFSLIQINTLHDCYIERWALSGLGVDSSPLTRKTCLLCSHAHAQEQRTDPTLKNPKLHPSHHFLPKLPHPLKLAYAARPKTCACTYTAQC